MSGRLRLPQALGMDALRQGTAVWTSHSTLGKPRQEQRFKFKGSLGYTGKLTQPEGKDSPIRKERQLSRNVVLLSPPCAGE